MISFLAKVKGYCSDVWFLIGTDRSKIPAIIFIFLFSSALDLIGLGLIGGYITAISDDSMIQESAGFLREIIQLVDPEKSLTIFGLALISIFSIKGVVGIGAQRLILSFSLRQMASLRVRAFRAIQALPFEEFLKQGSAEYLRVVSSYTSQFNTSLLLILKLAGDAFLVIAVIGFLSILAPLFVVAMVVIGISLVLFYDRLFRQKLRKSGVEMNEGDNLVTVGVQEGSRGFKEMRILGREKIFLDVVERGAIQSMTARLFIGVVSASPRFFVEWIVVIFVVSFASISLADGKSAESLYAVLGMFALAAIRLGPLVSQAMHATATLRSARPAISGLRAQFSYFESVRHSSPAKSNFDRTVLFSDLVLNQIEVKYSNSSLPVFTDVSLHIRRGDRIAIVGESGIGKTTLIDTLLGLIPPAKGQIFFNGQDLKNCVDMWRSKVAYLPQETFILDGTISQNIALNSFDEFIDKTKLDEAIRRCRLDELVASYPKGLRTRLGEMGSFMSGGQRQRVALARALYHDREVLILDEATSALDQGTEAEIINEIKHLGVDFTVILISHKLDTLDFCSKVFRLEKNSLSEIFR
ncbi:ATP-binding cassette domain-containing protein [Arenicellales bacterium IMCC56312]